MQFSSDDFDQSAFAISRRLRVPHGKTNMPNDPTGMPRPRWCVRRVPPPSPAAVVHEILQWRPHPSILGEGCAVLACRRTGRADSLPPSSRRAAPPICPDLIFDRHGLVKNSYALSTLSSSPYPSAKPRTATVSCLNFVNGSGLASVPTFPRPRALNRS